MPKKRRPENRNLPSRWVHKHGAYYYRPKPGQEHKWADKKFYRLGKTLPEAYREWAKRLDELEKAKTINDLLDRYALEVIPTKAPATQRGNIDQMKRLRGVFGEMHLNSITPQLIYRYADKRGAKVAAKREIALLSHAYTKAVEWGYLPSHPFKGEIRLEGQKARDRYIEDWEVIECLNLPSPMEKGGAKVAQAYIKLKLLTALRRADLLQLQTSNLMDDGIHLTISKSKKKVIFKWTDSLRAAVNECLAVRPVDISPFLFCTREGNGYWNEDIGKAESWDSLWGRFMKRVLEETKVNQKFTEHDLRAKAGSDAESLERAQQLLTHSSASTTQKFYRRKAEIITPFE